MAPILFALILAGQSTASCCKPDGMAQFANDPTFLAVHGIPAPLHFTAVNGKDVQFTVNEGRDKAANGFYVGPKKGSHSAIILVHEYWGLNDYIKREAERLNEKTGYAVLAIDMYDGKVATDSKTAAAYMQGADPARDTAIAEGAIENLKAGVFGFRPKTIGTVGYCFGGGWSERTAIAGGPNVQACVVYYGMPDTSPESLNRLQAPVLMFAAGNDQWINEKVVMNFADAMKSAGKSLEYHIIPGAYHAFANPSNPHYDKANAEVSMKREIAFFKSHL